MKTTSKVKKRQDAESSVTQASTQARLSVRPATALDAEPLSFFFDTALRNDYFLRRGQLEEMLEGKHHKVFVAELDTVLVGVAIQTAGTRLVNVLVHPAYRGLGIGRELVRVGGATEVRCKLDMSSGDPRAFYAALGFKSTGQRNDKGNIEVLQKIGKKSRDRLPREDRQVGGQARRATAGKRKAR